MILWWLMQHVWRVLVHKVYVWRAGRLLKVPVWQLLVHDLSKLGPSEALGYARAFYGEPRGPLGEAWDHHVRVNPHHWEHWCRRWSPDGRRHSRTTPREIPEAIVREMLADWMAASKAYDGDWPRSVASWRWVQEHFYRRRIQLHPATYHRVAALLYAEVGPALRRLQR